YPSPTACSPDSSSKPSPISPHTRSIVMSTSLSKTIEATSLPEPHGQARLIAEELSRRFGKHRVVDGVSLSVGPGEVVGLLGPNGAGKTTTFFMFVGFLRADQGRILLGDRDITRLPMYRRARLGIGYLPQEASVFRKLSVKQNILSILEVLPMNKGDRKKRLEELLAEL